jgi:hypothetical protein
MAGRMWNGGPGASGRLGGPCAWPTHASGYEDAHGAARDRRRAVHARRAGVAHVHVGGPPRLRRRGRSTAGDSGRILLDRRSGRDLDGHDLTEGDRAVGSPGRGIGHRRRQHTRRGASPVHTRAGERRDRRRRGGGVPRRGPAKMDHEAAAEFERNVREMYDQMARIAITPRWVRYFDFGAGRMPRFLQELAERNES